MSKQLASQSKRAEKEAKKEKLKLKKAIEMGNTEGARIYAQNAIRQKNQSLQYLRLSSRVDAVASRVETAARMKGVTRSMGQIVSAMERSMADMNLEQITKTMDEFERQFEAIKTVNSAPALKLDMDVQSEYVESAINQTTAISTPAGQVDQLIAMVAEENGLELGEELGRIAPQQNMAVQAKEAEEEHDELSARLAKLKS